MKRSLPEPPSSTQKAKFRGLRGPLESSLIRVSERPDDPERWRSLLVVLTKVEDRLDRNRSFRERARPVPRLKQEWFTKAWPTAPPEVEIARSIASIGGGLNGSPLFVNVVGATEDQWGKRNFPASRPSQAVFHTGEPARVLADILGRRLVDCQTGDPLPLDATMPCAPEFIDGLLCGAVDWEGVVRWLPAMVLIDWRGSRPVVHRSGAASGALALYGFFKPLFHPQRIVVKGESAEREAARFPTSSTARRLLYCIRSGDWKQAVRTAQSRYEADGRSVIAPPTDIQMDGEQMAAALLIPMRTADVAAGFARWLEPYQEEDKERKRS
jgi:CRISPR-associated protein Csx17